VSDRVRIDLKDGVADLRLDRPEKHNALDTEGFAALREAGRSVASDPSVRAVVLSGNGPSFCAGLDTSSFARMAGGDGGGAREGGDRSGGLLRAGDDSPANSAQAAAWVWREVPVPVIAAVHGVAYGAGLQVALGADLRIVAPDARLSVMEIHWGLIPDVAFSQTLRGLVRLDVARELTFTGRIVPGGEAVELGLATRTSERPLDDALALAREIAQKSPDAIRAAKRLLSEAPLTGVAEGLALEASLQSDLIGSPNQTEAVTARLQKRAPDFRDPG